jgi:hypothetical protein
MKATAVLLYYTSSLHTPKGHRAGAGENPGEVSCRVRTYVHADDVTPSEGTAILEETHVLTDESLAEHALVHRAVWDEADIKALLAQKLKLDVI